MDFTIGRTLGSREFASSTVNSFIRLAQAGHRHQCTKCGCVFNEAYSTDLITAALLCVEFYDRHRRSRRLFRAMVTRGVQLTEEYNSLQLFPDGRRFGSFRLRHVITTARTHLESSHFALCVSGFYAHDEFVHAAIVFFLIAEGEAEVVPRVEIPNHARQAGAVVPHAADVNSFATALLRRALAAAGDT